MCCSKWIYTKNFLCTYLLIIFSRLLNGSYKDVVAKGLEGITDPQRFQNRWIFENFNVSSENFRTLAVSKDIGLEFHRKIFELAPSLYRCYEASGLLRAN